MSSVSEHSRKHRKLCLRDQQWSLGPGVAGGVEAEAAAGQAGKLVRAGKAEVGCV